MNKVVRLNPVRDLLNMRSEMDRVMESFFNQPDDHQAATSWGIALDVVENEGGYEISAAVPGLKPDEIDVTINDGVLTIQAETSLERDETSEDQPVRVHIRERRYGQFTRSLRLPTDVDFDKIEANHENGVLTLTLPKSEAAKPRKIEIKK